MTVFRYVSKLIINVIVGTDHGPSTKCSRPFCQSKLQILTCYRTRLFVLFIGILTWICNGGQFVV